MQYNLKFWQEVAWAGLVSALVFALTAVAGFDVTVDTRGFLVALGAGSIRAAAGAMLGAITRKRD